jgi:hypothetical protein
MARGVVHFHAVIGLDANTPDGYAPPARYTAALLCDAITLAARPIRLDVHGSGPRIRLGFGRELDARPIRREDFAATGRKLDVEAVANYIAPSTPPRPPTSLACPTPESGTRPKSKRCTARPTTSAWSPPPGISARGPPSAIRGFGCGPTCSATAATSSPSPAATPSPFGYIRGERTTKRQAGQARPPRGDLQGMVPPVMLHGEERSRSGG